MSNSLRVVFALLAGFSLGSYRAGQVIEDQKIATSYIGRETIITATIQDWPEVKNNQTRLHLGSPYLNYSTSVLNCQIYAIIPGVYNNLERSDQITLRAKLSEGFGDYVASVYQPTIVSLSKPDPPDYFTRVRSSFTERVR